MTAWRPGNVVAELEAWSPSERMRALLIATRGALVVWTQSAPDELVYHDSVVGVRHQLDVQLPHRVVEELERATATNTVPRLEEADAAYREPIVALRDEDLELAPAADLAYRAIFLLSELALGRDVGIGAPAVVLSRALESHGDFERATIIWWWAVSTWRTLASVPSTRLPDLPSALVSLDERRCALAEAEQLEAEAQSASDHGHEYPAGIEASARVPALRTGYSDALASIDTPLLDIYRGIRLGVCAWRRDGWLRANDTVSRRELAVLPLDERRWWQLDGDLRAVTRPNAGPAADRMLDRLYAPSHERIARAHGAVSAFRVVSYDADQRSSVADFATLDEAARYADDVVWEDALNDAYVYDAHFALVHRGSRQSRS